MPNGHWPVPNFVWPNCRPAFPTTRLRYFWHWAVAGSNRPRPTRRHNGRPLNSMAEGLIPAACLAGMYLARAKMAEDWSAKTGDAELRQGWLKIAEEYRLLAQALQVNRSSPKKFQFGRP